MLNKKFTLIEVIVSIVILGVLLSIVLIQVQNIKERAVTSYIMANTKEIQNAIDKYYLENESYPVTNNLTITLENPQYVDVTKLYKEGYFKKDIDLAKYSEQHYKIDVFGRVWGASEPSLENSTLVKEENGVSQVLTVDVNEDIDLLKVYKVTNGKLVTVAQYQTNSYTADSKGIANNKITFKEISEIENNNFSKFQIKIENPNETYLIGGLDQYGLEIAPVGFGYDSEAFEPIRGGEGEYEYMLESFTQKEWLDFITLESTPSDSKIEYQFALKNDKKGEYGVWLNSFPEGEKSYGIKVKIKMTRGSDGSKPSLHWLKITYKMKDKKILNPLVRVEEHFPVEYDDGQIEEVKTYSYSGVISNEIEPAFCPESSLSSRDTTGYHTYVYSYQLEDNNVVESLNLPNITNSNYKEVIIEYSKGKVINQQVSSYRDIPSGSCINIILIVDLGSNPNNVRIIPPPFISEIQETFTYWNDVVVNSVYGNSNNQNEEYSYSPGLPKTAPKSDKEVYDPNWETIDDIRFFQQGMGETTTWYGYKKSDEVIEDKTRILYRFALGDGYYWSAEMPEFPDNEDSNGIMVHVYFQVHKKYLNDSSVPDPKLNWIKIQSSDGEYDLSLDRPQLLIYPEKNNNLNRSTISTESEITWKYIAEDPNEFEIEEVQWKPELTASKIKYSAGKHVVQGRVKNSEGLWSNWATYEFNVVEEKPTANFIIKGNLDYIGKGQKIEFDTSSSSDPDGDKIENYEWKNKQNLYNSTSGTSEVISLRVQDSEGHWSDWFEKSYYVVNPEDDFWFVDGVPAVATDHIKAFDNNASTYSVIPFTNSINITWAKDISGSALQLNVAPESGYGAGNFQFLDENGKELYFLSNIAGSEYVNILGFDRNEINHKVIVPENAKSLKINSIYSYYGDQVILKSINLVNSTNRIGSVSNIEDRSSKFIHSATWSTNKDAIKTFVIDEKENKLIFSGQVNDFSRKSIAPNKEIEYKFISVNKDFIPSNSVVKKLKTLDSKVVFSGFKDYSAFDEDVNTMSAIAYSGKENTTSKVTWDKDITGEVIYVRTSVSFYGSAEFRFIDKNGNKLKFFKDDNTYVNTVPIIDRTLVEFKAIVPNGAVAIEFFSHYSYYGGEIYVNSIELVEYNENTPIIKDIVETSTKYVHSANWKQDSSVVYTMVIDMEDNLMGLFKGNSFEVKSLKPNTTATYKFVSFDSNFTPSKEVMHTFKTKTAEVNFSGLKYSAFDEDEGTFDTINYLGGNTKTLVSWDKDITGRTIAVKSAVSAYGAASFRFVDKGGNILPFNKDGNTLVNDVPFYDRTGVEFKAIVPEGAVGIEFFSYASYYDGNIYVHSVHLND